MNKEQHNFDKFNNLNNDINIKICTKVNEVLVAC